MRNVSKKVVFILIVMYSISNWATNFKPALEIHSIGSKLLNIKIKKFQMGVFFKIINNNKVTLYIEDVKAFDFSKSYDLKSLENGQYFIEVHEQMLIRKVPVKIYADRILIETEKEIIVYNPIVHVNGDIVSIGRSVLDKNGDLEVSLYDEDSNLIYKEVIENNYLVGRILNIKRLIKGDYQLRMETDETVFVKTIKKVN